MAGYCPTCGAAQPTRARFCPICGQPAGGQGAPLPPPPVVVSPRRRGRGCLATLAIIGLLLVGGVVALGSAGGSTTGSTTTNGAVPTGKSSGATGSAPPRPSTAITTTNGAVPTPQDARTIDPRVVAANSDPYVDMNYYIQGRVVAREQRNTTNDTWFQVLAVNPDGTSESTIVAAFESWSPADIQIDTCYGFYGLGDVSAFVRIKSTGNNEEVPILRVYRYGTVPATTVGGCATPNATRP